MPDVAIVSCIMGGYDELKPACPQDVECEWLLVTDDDAISDGDLGWRVIHEPRPGVDPCRAAKAPKTRPWLYADAPASIWIDGSCRVTSPSFAREALALADPLAQFSHPDRDCIYVEAQVSSFLPRYAGEPVLKQAEHYRRRGHPEHWGLWAATVIARQHCPEVYALGEAWQSEIDNWSVQDQISQPYVLRNLGMRPAILPGYFSGNQWLNVEASRAHR